MKKTISTLLKVTAGILAGLIVAALPAGAAQVIVSGQTAQSGIIYEFTAPDNGVLTILGNQQYVPSPDILFSEEINPAEIDYSKVVSPTQTIVTDNGTEYYFTVTAHTTYYFFAERNALGMSPTFTFTFKAGQLPNEIAILTPEPNTAKAYNLNVVPMVEISFLRQETFTGNPTLVYETTDGTTASTPVSFQSTYKGSNGDILYYEFSVKSAISQVKSMMKDGSVFTLLISDPKVGGEAVTGPAKYLDSDGAISLSYYYEAQTSLESRMVPDVFLSFWPENSENGLITMTFDGPLAPMSQQTKDLTLSIFAGSINNEDSDWPRLPGAPMSIEGNILTVDLRGVQRITDQQVVSILIEGLVDAKGEPIDYLGGNVIHLLDMPYELLKQATLDYEFDPKSGSLLGVESVELWVEGACFRSIAIEGFRFTAPSLASPVEVSLETASPVEDKYNPGSIIYTIPVPEEVKETANVTLSAVLNSLDGYEYSISTEFNTGNSSVEAPVATEAESVIFNLHGQPVKNPAPGIYIVDGRKVVVK